MKDIDFIPAIVFGALLGALITLLAIASRLSLTGLTPALITSTTTIIVGWWIHKAVRRRGELDRIPIDYLSKLNHRIDARISACLENPKQIANFTILSNEIHWQIVLLREMRPDLNVLGEEIATRYFQFKEHLTGSESADITSASKTSHEIRITALRIQWKLSRHVLDRPGGVDVLKRRTDRQAPSHGGGGKTIG